MDELNSARRDRLNRLSVTLAEGGQDLGGDERAVVRAAAEITGLTGLTVDGCYSLDPETLSALRRFAELAKSE